MQGKPTEAELKARVHHEQIGSTTVFYSLVRKEGRTFSMLTNERLLLYDNQRRILFYINDTKNLPFAPNLPHPKNDVSTPLATSTLKNPSNTPDIQVRHTGRNAKGELETVEWNFACESPQLAKEWMTLLEEEKNRIVAETTGEKDAGFLHDALLEAARPPPKETILKPEEQLIKPAPLQDSRNNSVAESFILNHPPDQPSRIRKSEHEPEPQESRISLPLMGSRSALRSREPATRESQMEVSQVQRVEVGSQLRTDPPRRQEQSAIREPERSSLKYQVNDWNMKFLRNSHEATIVQFQQAANAAFHSVWQRDSPTKGGLREYEESGLVVRVANVNSGQARTLKQAFRNWHFVLESCKAKLVVGVPLACLIEWQGVIALLKAPVPASAHRVPLAKALPDIRDLERYTRVSNNVLENAVLKDVTEAYGENGDRPLIFLDELPEYLPMHADQDLPPTALRPQFLLDSVTQVLPGGRSEPGSREWRAVANGSGPLGACVRALAGCLNGQERLWAQALDLKEIFHSFGVNMKLLPRVYAEVTNKQVRRQLMSVMAAKVAKDSLTADFIQAFREGQAASRAPMVQRALREWVSGGTAGGEAWKSLALQFKKQYGIPLNNTELAPGFFLNSLLALLRVNCDMGRLNQTKRLFKEDGVLQSGFVTALEPKSKSYSRFTTEMQERLRFALAEERKDEAVYDALVEHLRLDSGPLPAEYAQGTAQECLLEYLAFYTPPKALDSSAPLRGIPIYAAVFRQPPSGFSLRVTRAFLEWSIKKDKAEEFKRGMEAALRVADYWLEEAHLHHAELYELLSDFYLAHGSPEESVNFMKEALSRTLRAAGPQSSHAANRYYLLAQRQLRAGRKREASEDFAKARQGMEATKPHSLKYPQLLLRQAALHLNSGDLESAIAGCLDAIREFEEYDRRSGDGGVQSEPLKVKAFEVLSRAYEVAGRREETRDMALLCARKFNRSHSPQTYDQMLRICLAACVFRHSQQRADAFVDLVSRQQEDQGESQEMSADAALRELMALSESTVVMEKFMGKYDHLEKTISEASSKRVAPQESRDFLRVVRLLTGAVGQDFIQGLAHQKQYE